MFVFENCWFVSYLAALNANDALGNDMAWLVKIIHVCRWAAKQNYFDCFPQGIASVSLLNFCLFSVIIDDIIQCTLYHIKCLGDLLSTSDWQSAGYF